MDPVSEALANLRQANAQHFAGEVDADDRAGAPGLGGHGLDREVGRAGAHVEHALVGGQRQFANGPRAPPLSMPRLISRLSAS